MKKYISILSIIASIALISCSKDDDYGGGGGYTTPPVTMGNLEIATDSMSFYPSPLTATVGDTIIFVIGMGHTATRVDEAMWLANDATSNGGFDFPEGTYTYVIQPADVGTIYYVCKFHVSMGMKGTIVVSDASYPSENE